MSDQAAVGIVILIVLSLLALWIRDKLTPKPDYSKATRKVNEREPDWYMIQHQELMARELDDFRAGR